MKGISHRGVTLCVHEADGHKIGPSCSEVKVSLKRAIDVATRGPRRREKGGLRQDRTPGLRLG